MSPNNILVCAEGQLGDLLLLTPAIRALRTGHPEAKITVLILHRHPSSPAGSTELVTAAEGSGTSAVMTQHPCVDEVLEADRSRLRALRGIARIRGELDVLHAIRARRFDSVVCTFPEDRFAALAFLSGAVVRVGQKRQALSRLLNRKPDIEKKSMGVLKYYCRLAESAGGRAGSERTEFYIPSEADSAAASCLRERGLEGTRWVAVHPGASGDYKIWPPERFAALLDGLRQKNVRAALLGGAGDGEILEAIQSKLSGSGPGSIANAGSLGTIQSRLAGSGSGVIGTGMSLGTFQNRSGGPLPGADAGSNNPEAMRGRPESSIPVMRTGNDVGLLAALIHRAALCITNDSGPRHLALAVGTPSLALFRQFHAMEWGVYPESPTCVTITGTQPCPACPPSACLDRAPEGERYGAECLRQISVEAVLTRVLQMLCETETTRPAEGGTSLA